MAASQRRELEEPSPSAPHASAQDAVSAEAANAQLDNHHCDAAARDRAAASIQSEPPAGARHQHSQRLSRRDQNHCDRRDEVTANHLPETAPVRGTRGARRRAGGRVAEAPLRRELDRLRGVDRPHRVVQRRRAGAADTGHRQLVELVGEFRVGEGRVGVALARRLVVREATSVRRLDLDARGPAAGEGGGQPWSATISTRPISSPTSGSASRSGVKPSRRTLPWTSAEATTKGRLNFASNGVPLEARPVTSSAVW